MIPSLLLCGNLPSEAKQTAAYTSRTLGLVHQGKYSCSCVNSCLYFAHARVSVVSVSVRVSVTVRVSIRVRASTAAYTSRTLQFRDKVRRI